MLIDPLVLFQTPPSGVFAVPQQIAVDVGLLARYADLVAVEVAGLLAAFAVFVGPITYLCQGFVGIWVGVDIGIPAVRVDFLQQMAAVPNEAGFIFEAAWNFFVFQTAFSYPSAQGIVAVRPRFFRAVFFEDFGFNQLVMQVVEIVLHFAVCQFAVDQVAEVVVVIAFAVGSVQVVFLIAGYRRLRSI